MVKLQNYNCCVLYGFAILASVLSGARFFCSARTLNRIHIKQNPYKTLIIYTTIYNQFGKKL